LWGDVVLKVSEDDQSTVIARLEKERELLEELRSPHYPRLYFAGAFSSDPVTEARLGQRLFVTIEERIVGGHLGQRRHEFATEHSVVVLLSSLVQGLSSLWNHPRRIVHRDLKPENILIRPTGEPVVIDLGIVREQGASGLTGTHWNIGPCTPAYASPEQLTNNKLFINFKADFFSLGVIAYELLAGQNPFRKSPSDPLEVVIHRAINEHPPTLLSLGKTGARTSVLVERLMAKEPYRRPRTVSALADELGLLAGDLGCR